MYKPVSTNLDFVSREVEVQQFWKDNEIFEKMLKLREGKEVFTFYDGPPTANGKPHIGHVLTRAIKDLIPRYKTMKGYNVTRKAGWDTHGLPVELEVEKTLGISGKPQIEEYGVEPFIKKCKESVWKYKDEWENMSARVGFWADMEHPYVTYENNYIESVWWSLKKIWDKDLLYKGHKVVPYCPRCGTALSSHEVAQGYEEVTESSVIASFKLKGRDEYFLAWTTTPWTLPSNVALVVNPKETYAKVKSGGKVYIMAEALLETVMKEAYEIIDKCTGKELEYTEYEPVFNQGLEPKEKAWYVACADYVTLTDGTGIVHTAPAFGEDDAMVGRAYGLPFVQLVDESGKFIAPVQWEGMFVKDADPLIIKQLEADGTLYKEEPYTHNYPFCWRCHTPLLYYARNTWFVKMSSVRDSLVKYNENINWIPENIKHGRYGKFLENVIDWGLSRERYWGTPLPIWECECGHKHAIGSVEELSQMSGSDCSELELHKPYIDNVYLNCPKCGGKMKRVTEVIDCWYDSGAMPFAQWHYPFENKEIFEANFPANFISEAVDQTRGWFYTLHAISTLIFEQNCFENCIVLGHVQDKDGRKMSKHLGNVVDPKDVLDKQGADAVRWYFYTNSSPWLPNRFHGDAVSENQRKFMGTLWNTYAFYILYAEIDSFDPTKYKLEKDKLPPIDLWILSKLNTLVKNVDEGLEAYKIFEPARALTDFVDKLSNWYVRRSRERFWASGMEQDKINAYMTLYTVLDTLTKLSAPFTPFMADEIYQNLVRTVDKNAPESVHLTDFPEYNADFIDLALEEDMDLVLDIVVLGRAGRNDANIKNRQPIGNMFVKAPKELGETYVSIIAGELNLKNVTFSQDVENLTTYKFKPQLKTLGPKYGKILPKISAYLSEVDGNAFMNELKCGSAKFDIEGQPVELTMEDVLVETAEKEGFLSETDGDITIVLDTNLTDELIEEGFVREIISKIQTMRKEAGFEVLDRIDVWQTGSAKLSAIFDSNMAEIKADVLADNIQEGSGGEYSKEWNINGENVTLGVKRK
ncbi:isoleucine--tRNA ligase [Tyzzerella sp. OttesenSCG-928-J15]|nr:isoleucine--tRNA ligase [Tyzzerella sp. OttesenSCG-928-J15]